VRVPEESMPVVHDVDFDAFDAAGRGLQNFKNEKLEAAARGGIPAMAPTRQNEDDVLAYLYRVGMAYSDSDDSLQVVPPVMVAWTPDLAYPDARRVALADINITHMWDRIVVNARIGAHDQLNVLFSKCDSTRKVLRVALDIRSPCVFPRELEGGSGRWYTKQLEDVQNLHDHMRLLRFRP